MMVMKMMMTIMSGGSRLRSEILKTWNMFMMMVMKMMVMVTKMVMLMVLMTMVY